MKLRAITTIPQTTTKKEQKKEEPKKEVLDKNEKILISNAIEDGYEGIIRAGAVLGYNNNAETINEVIGATVKIIDSTIYHHSNTEVLNKFGEALLRGEILDVDFDDEKNKANRRKKEKSKSVEEIEEQILGVLKDGNAYPVLSAITLLGKENFDVFVKQNNLEIKGIVIMPIKRRTKE